MRSNRLALETLIEATLWAVAAGACVFAAIFLWNKDDSTFDLKTSIIPVPPTSEEIQLNDTIVGAALDLLSRVDSASEARLQAASNASTILRAAPLPPVQPAARPTLRGIIWTPSIEVLLEAPGLPSGGALMRLNTVQGEFRLIAVRGDTAFVRGRDSTWVLLLGSRNP